MQFIHATLLGISDIYVLYYIFAQLDIEELPHAYLVGSQLKHC